MKMKEVKFRRTSSGRLEGRQDNVLYTITPNYIQEESGIAIYYSVSAKDTIGKGRDIETKGHKLFQEDTAKEFCQQIAAGIISADELQLMREEFEAEDAARQEVFKQANLKAAEEFRSRLKAAGITYTDFLDLMAEWEKQSGEVYNILLDWENKEE